MSHKTFTIVFSCIVLLELICESIEHLNYFRYITKPAIVTSLIIYFLANNKHLNKNTRYIILGALLGSLIGDILLMFVHLSATFFITGLIAFLCAHSMYIIAFLKKRNLQIKPYKFMVLLIVYSGGLFYLLKDGLGNMLVPVVVYMAIILSMATTALLRKNSVSKSSFLFVFIGAICFLLSDSILAVNKFYNPFPLAGISIMLTYALAQYFIVLGIIKQTH